MSNPRFQDVAPGVHFETLAPRTRIEWDPTTGDGTITFDCRKYLSANGAYVEAIQPAVNGALSLSLPSLFTRTFPQYREDLPMVDPVTGADLTNVSGAGMALILRAAFDAVYRDTFGTGAS